MARKTSKTGGSNGKRKKATRPPIIDVSPKEVPDEQAKSNAQDFAVKARDLWWRLLDQAAGVFRDVPAILTGRQRHYWLGGLAGVVVLAVLFALLLKPAPIADPGPILQAIMEQRLARSDKQIADLSRQVAAMAKSLRADIGKAILEQKDREKNQSVQSGKIADAQQAFVARLSTSERALQATNEQIERQFKAITSGLEEVRRQVLAGQTSFQNSNAALKIVRQRLVKLEAKPRRSKIRPRRASKPRSIAQIEKIKTAGLALVAVLETKNGFVDKLNDYAKTMPGDPLIGWLKPYAKTGALRVETLRLQAQAFAASSSQASRQTKLTEEAGVYERISAWSQSIVRVRRRQDKNNQGRAHAKAWARIAAHLKANRLDEGLAIALTLPGNQAQSVWIKQAQARLLINRQVPGLKARIAALNATKAQPRKGG